jgi:aryl-alcohol dehydrogenase-like predicted oxidoreductase
MEYGSIAGIAADQPLSRLILGIVEHQSPTTVEPVLDAFLAAGGTTVDSAWSYGKGRQDKLIGAWLRKRGVRNEVRLIEKGGGRPVRPESIMGDLQQSLERLGADHVDLFLLHRDNEQVPVGEFVDALDRLQQQGLIHAFGGSNWRRSRFAAANRFANRHGLRAMAALSNQFSLAQWTEVPWPGCRTSSDLYSRAWLTSTRTPLLAWSSQARGFFARADRNRREDADLVRCWYSEPNFRRLDRARYLAAMRRVAPTAVALAYVLRQPFPTFALIGPRNVDELRCSLNALDVELTEDDLRWLNLEAPRERAPDGSGAVQASHGRRV